MLKFINYNSANVASQPLTPQENLEVVEIINILLQKANSESPSTENLLQRFINDHARLDNHFANTTSVAVQRVATNLEQAKELFFISGDPVICKISGERGGSTVTVLDLQQADEFFGQEGGPDLLSTSQSIGAY